MLILIMYLTRLEMHPYWIQADIVEWAAILAMTLPFLLTLLIYKEVIVHIFRSR